MTDFAGLALFRGDDAFAFRGPAVGELIGGSQQGVEHDGEVGRGADACTFLHSGWSAAFQAMAAYEVPGAIAAVSGGLDRCDGRRFTGDDIRLRLGRQLRQGIVDCRDPRLYPPLRLRPGIQFFSVTLKRDVERQRRGGQCFGVAMPQRQGG